MLSMGMLAAWLIDLPRSASRSMPGLLPPSCAVLSRACTCVLGANLLGVPPMDLALNGLSRDSVF